jgi:NADH-quinone oxidoreductase subunit E
VNKLKDKYSDEIQKIFSKYPSDQKRSAVMPLLFLAQRESGYVNMQSVNEIAEILELKPTEVAGIIGFYTLYHDEPGGAIRIQVCTDLPCALRGADKFLADLCQALNIQSGETTPDGLITVEEVMCLAACDKAPMFQTQTRDGIQYHENMTVEGTLELIESWKSEAE